jgi:hypothetical protein
MTRFSSGDLISVGKTFSVYTFGSWSKVSRLDISHMNIHKLLPELLFLNNIIVESECMGLDETSLPQDISKMKIVHVFNDSDPSSTSISVLEKHFQFIPLVRGVKSPDLIFHI